MQQSEGVVYVSDAERKERLRSTVDEYVANGWQVDDDLGFSVIISKRFGWEYGVGIVLAVPAAIAGLLTLGLVQPHWDWLWAAVGGCDFKRRLLAVDRTGTVTVTKMEPRGSRTSRYAS